MPAELLDRLAANPIPATQPAATMPTSALVTLPSLL